MARGRREPTFEIVEEIAVLKEGEKSNTTLELNKVSWNGNPPKLELRWWRFDEEGNRRADRGLGVDDEIWDDLVPVLLRLGYGETEEVKRIIKARAARKEDEGAPERKSGKKGRKKE